MLKHLQRLVQWELEADAGFQNGSLKIWKCPFSEIVPDYNSLVKGGYDPDFPSK